RTISDVAFLDAKVITAQISLLRSRLSEPEIERFRHLGSLCAEAITATAYSIHPGMSEFEIAAQLGKEAQQRGVQPIVNLIATDERAMAFRHPLPTAKTLNHYVLLVLSGRKSGLVCSISRMVHFGKLPDELQARIQAAAQVNAALIASSRPGKTLGEILKIGQQAYAAAGFPDEWQQHHQGGLTGYEPREILATPDESLTLEARQVVAWNPTVQGAKMEDSVVLNDYGFEVLTNTPAWPLQMVQFAGQADPAPCALALRL
ncbi:MAG TPA: M24 family metallopeptidase, partial [Anaerolineaceae bacterium]|nr:M24 family metallopeptidase [Anaerolineaceae bacterium]